MSDKIEVLQTGNGRLTPQQIAASLLDQSPDIEGLIAVTWAYLGEHGTQFSPSISHTMMTLPELLLVREYLNQEINRWMNDG